jgi:hypothetical protein
VISELAIPAATLYLPAQGSTLGTDLRAEALIQRTRIFVAMDGTMRERREEGVIEYPCLWAYRVIGREREGGREAVEAILGDREFLLTYARASSKGNYHSWHVELVVSAEEERDTLFALLKGHPAVMMVI